MTEQSHFELPVPHDGRRIAMDRAPVWMVNLPLILGCVVVLLIFVTISMLVAGHQRHLPWVVGYVFVFVVLWPIAAVAYRMTVTAYTRIVIDDERLTWREGIFNRRVISVELYRIQNVEARMTWWQQLADFGTLIIETSDAAYPTWVLPGMPQPEPLREALIRYSIALRAAKGVREFNMGQV